MDSIEKEMLDDLTWDLIKLSYEGLSLNNMHTHKKKYVEFCSLFKLTPFPVTQWQLARFRTYLSFLFTSPSSIENYLATLCMINELSGHGKVSKGLIYKKMIQGVRKKLRHHAK